MKNQEKIEKKFIQKAKKLGYGIRTYSGRFMYGRECPAVVVDDPYDFIAEMGMKGLKVDNMGLQYVVYTG